MAKNGIVAALDIGTSKIVCFVASINSSGDIDVKGIGHQISQGICSGKVLDVKKAESCILSAINSAEKMASETIESAIINVSGSVLDSFILEVETSVSGQEITDRDIHKITQIGQSHIKDNDKNVIHTLTTDYAIDDLDGIKDPLGMFGEKLQTNIHIISSSRTITKNLENCLARCQLDVEDFVATPYVSGLATLSDDEKSLGAIHLDIGAGLTATSIFKDGYCIYVGSVPIGGNHITRDIATGLSISLEYAERIKTVYGTVLNLSDLSSDQIVWQDER